MTTPEGMMPERSRDEVLAGEYVLGVLSAQDRRKVEARIVLDPTFAALVTRWQGNLESLNDAYQPEQVPAWIKTRVDQRLFGEAAAKSGLWSSLGFWRGLSFASVALVAVMGGASLGVLKFGAPGKPLTAELSAVDKPTGIDLTAAYDPGSGKLRFTPIAEGQDAKSLELWLIKGDNPAVSLGVLPQSGSGELLVPSKFRDLMGEGVTLAISVEQFGGSPTGQHQGPIVAVGSVKSK